ncbi:MAG: VWA domain-containing protein [Planctomycetota bacterium]|jgi:hypothetical protein
MLRSVPSFLRALASAALLLVAVQAQDEGKLLAAFDKAFAPPPKGKATLDEKRAALAALRDLDSGKVAEALAEGWLATDAELAEIEGKRDKTTQQIAKMVEGQPPGQVSLPSDQLAEYERLQKELPKLRAQADAVRSLVTELTARIGTLQRRDSVLWLLQRVCGNKNYAAPLKVAAGKAIGAAAGQVMEELAATLPKMKEPTDLIVLLDAFAAAGKAAAPHATPVLALLEHKEEAVAERAAQALAKLAVPAAIAPMLKLLERATGQSKARVVAALEILTGQSFGTNLAAWQSWWQKEGATVAKGGQELGGGTPSKRSVRDDLYYFGIPQDTCKSILYVIDCSGSMEAKVQLQTTGTSAGGKVPETTRLEACKKELIRGLGQLRPDQKFAILWYNQEPHFWEPKMQLASKETVMKAQAFVQTLRSSGSTNIHDSLEMGFRLSGRGSKDKYYGMEIDTVFLLTDGAPTTPDGKLDSTDKILASCRTWNPLKRVVIHCIAIGRDLNAEFLRQLASENGGDFKQF